MKLLAVDPSSTVLGWAVMDGDNLVDYGLVSTSKVSYDMRFRHILTQLSGLRDRYKFQQVACERAFMIPGRNLSALHVAITSIKKWAIREQLPFALYSPGEWKVTATGHGNADKLDVAGVVRLQYHQLAKDVSDHITDAIGIGLHHLSVRRLEAMVRKGG